MCGEGNTIQKVEALATRVEIGIENNGLPTTKLGSTRITTKIAKVSEQT